MVADPFDLTGKVAVVTGAAGASAGPRPWPSPPTSPSTPASAAATCWSTTRHVAAELYLASAASSYTTGAVIKVDGGAAYPPA
ncbi:MAG TPA: hypothetical protein VFP61_12605 [Acidimicrobiales bacterium]|nr:hypothetical protein [Acidimicrobiales bacterium]